jgi:pimeloyl-ACP methyl ester carboxylesterase
LPLDAIEVDGQRLEYADVNPSSRDPALVIVHGGNCDAQDWANVAPRLAHRYRVILPDGLVYPLDPWWIWLLLDHLGVEDATLLGHSAGGAIVVAMYRQQPRRVPSLVTIDSEAVGPTILARLLPHDRFSPYAAALYEQRRVMMAQLKGHHQGDYPSEVNIAHRLIAYQRAAMTPEQRAATRPAPRTIHRIAGAGPAPAMIPDTGKFITCPLLVFHTGRGKLGPEDVSQEWIDQHIHAADVEYVVLRETSHWPWHELPEWFLSRLEPFLARTGAALPGQSRARLSKPSSIVRWARPLSERRVRTRGDNQGSAISALLRSGRGRRGRRRLHVPVDD